MVNKKNKKELKEKAVRQEVKKAMTEVRDTFATSTTLIISALTFVASFAWRDFTRAAFEYFEKYISGWGELLGQFIYACTVTLIVVLIVKRLKKVQSKVGGESIK